MDVAPQRSLGAGAWALLVAALLLAVNFTQESALPSGLTFTGEGPNGQGASTITVSYGLPQRAQVGSNLTVPLSLSVDNLTGLMAYFQGYNVSVRLALSNGRSLSGTAGVSTGGSGSNEAPLHAGQSWGPVNVTIPLDGANTGLGEGQQALGNVTLQVAAVVWLGRPVNSSTVLLFKGNMGYTLVANGKPTGERPNVVGLALLVAGIAILTAAVAWRRPKRPPSAAAGSAPGRKPPGAI